MVGSVAKRHGFSFRTSGSDPNIILDIDEDYFATGDTILPLMAVGWSNRSLAKVDAVLMQLCAPSERVEHLLAEMIAAAVMNG